MSFLITTSWDDGHPCDLKLAELLEQYGIQATFYTPQRSQRPVLSANDLRSIADRFELGAHGIDHVPLTALPFELAQRQVIESKAWIEQLTGQACTLFCPPLGRFHRAHVGMFAQNGLRGFRTVELGSIKAPQVCDGALKMIATTVQVYPHRKHTLAMNALRRFKFFRAVNAFMKPQTLDWLESTDHWLEQAHQTGGVFHLWGHSWEIDELGWWSHLEEILQRCRRYIDQGLAYSVSNSDLILK